jgi:glycolate oxidase iron-sulfur subunit
VFRVDGRESLTARGKMHLLTSGLADHPSPVFENLFSQCLLCGACEQVCPRSLPITDIISRARSRFSTFYGQHGIEKVAARSVLAHPTLLAGLVRAGISLQRLDRLPLGSGLRLKLGLLKSGSQPLALSEETGERKKVTEEGENLLYFSGCLARYLQPSVAEATGQLLQISGQSQAQAPPEQGCCGLAAWSAGKRDQARSLAQKNIAAFAGSEQPILTSCASCSSHLLDYPALFADNDPWQQRARQFADRVREFTSFFSSLLPKQQPQTEQSMRVFYHDPCHLRFRENGTTLPRKLLTDMGLEIVEPENSGSCCGQGGLFHLGYPELARTIFQKASNNGLARQPDCVTTTCSGCLMQYQEGLARQQDNTRVAHMAVLLVERSL